MNNQLNSVAVANSPYQNEFTINQGTDGELVHLNAMIMTNNESSDDEDAEDIEDDTTEKASQT